LDRKDFLRLSAMSAGGILIPRQFLAGRPVDPLQALQERMDISTKKQLANIALDAAKSKGATYADVRIGRYLKQVVTTREDKVEGITNTESFGAGVRVLVNGCWGFASSDNLNKETIAKIAERAVAVANANAKIQGEKVQLAPQKGYGDVSWKTPIEKNAFEVPLKEKADLLLSANAIAIQNGASFVDSSIIAVNEQKYFASTDGSYIDQDVHRLFPTFTVTGIDKAKGKFDSRQSLSAPVGMGYEYLVPSAKEKVTGVVTRYKKRYDIMEDIKAAASDVAQKNNATSVQPGKYDLVLDPSHLWLTIHESVGHPTELDRVLGYEANYAGTSFLTLDKWESKKFQFGNNKVNIIADKTQPGSLAAVGYDDEGVKCKEWDLIKNGILVNYQATRDQAHIIGEKESHGCSFAESWADVQFQRMPNVSLQPGKEQRSVDDIIKNVENGIYIIGDGSFSIDQQRYNFQFGGQLFYEIKNGKITRMLRDVAYQANSQQFWNSLADLADKEDYRLGGAFNDGKGQPSQINAVSHGCATARFNDVTVINTAR
jgi:TldD protein